MMTNVNMARINIKETNVGSALTNASDKIWIIESPIKAPHARVKKNLITISKHPSEACFLQQTNTMAVINPIKDRQNPANTP